MPQCQEISPDQKETKRNVQFGIARRISGNKEIAKASRQNEAHVCKPKLNPSKREVLLQVELREGVGSPQQVDRHFRDQQDAKRHCLSHMIIADLLKKYRPESRSLIISEPLLKYLLDDGTFIHPRYTRGSDPSQLYPEPFTLQTEDGSVELPLFPDLESFMKQCLDQWNEVFVKIAGKSFKDCKTWLRDLKVTHIEDLLMAAKCSQIVLDQIQAISQSVPKTEQLQFLTIQATPWRDIDQRDLFRAFYNPRLVKLATRDPSLAETHLKFFGQFEGIEPCVIDFQISKSRTLLVDCVPWQGSTNCQGDWQELSERQQLKIEQWKDQDLSRYLVPAQLGDEEDPSKMLLKLQQLMQGKGTQI